MLIEKLKNDANNALRNGEKEKRIVLSSLIGEIQLSKPEIINNEKIWSDAQVIKTIKKMMESNIICNNPSENKILEVYLPTSLSQSEIETLVENLINENGYSGMRDMGKIMSFFSKNYAGKYDGKIVSDIIKTKLV